MNYKHVGPLVFFFPDKMFAGFWIIYIKEAIKYIIIAGRFPESRM